MIRKYYNHKLLTNLWYCEEESHNNHQTPERQTKQSNQLFLTHRDNCKTRMDTKQCTTKNRKVTESHNGSNNQQRINNNKTFVLERTAAKATNAFCWHQIFALDSAVVEAQTMLSSHGGFLTIAIYKTGIQCLEFVFGWDHRGLTNVFL